MSRSLRQCFGTIDKIYQLDLPTKLCSWLSDFLVGRVIQVKSEGFLSPKVYPKAGIPQGSNLSPLLFLIYVNHMPVPSHHLTNKSQFADDTSQWAVSKSIDLAAEYVQRNLDKLASWCVKWRIKLNPERTKVIIFSQSQTAIRAEPALSLYGDLLSYYPHIKFLGITFDNRITFTEHFEEILERRNQKFHRLKILVNKKWGPSPATVLQVHKQCVRAIFEYGIVSTITVSESVINKIQRFQVQNSFIRLALRFQSMCRPALYMKPPDFQRLITVGQNHLARMHANPLAEHTINSARTRLPNKPKNTWTSEKDNGGSHQECTFPQFQTHNRAPHKALQQPKTEARTSMTSQTFVNSDTNRSILHF